MQHLFKVEQIISQNTPELVKFIVYKETPKFYWVYPEGHNSPLYRRRVEKDNMGLNMQYHNHKWRYAETIEEAWDFYRAYKEDESFRVQQTLEKINKDIIKANLEIAKC